MSDPSPRAGKLKCLTKDHVSLRFDVIVDLFRRDGDEGIRQMQRRILGRLPLPDMVQTRAADAAGEVGMELGVGSD